MKASEAPEKIWVHELSAKELNVPMKEYHVEYVRADAFIEKACEFLSKLSNYNEGFIYPSHSGVIDSFVNDFKNYMKGE